MKIPKMELFVMFDINENQENIFINDTRYVSLPADNFWNVC